MLHTLQIIFERDLNRLKKELEAYNDEANLWLIEKSISNSAGNLALHLVGNLKTFIGAAFANSGYIRQRDLEFSQKNVPRTEILTMIDETMEQVNKGLSQITEETLKAPCQHKFMGEKTNEYFLIHLMAHLSYHIGQINYHRRLLDS